MPILFIAALNQSSLLLLFLKQLSQEPHALCLGQSPTQSEWSSLYNAIVCGAQLDQVDLRKEFQSTGLIHLMVVSGAHLLLLEGILKKILGKIANTKRNKLIVKSLIFLLLFCYCLICQWRPPVVRAFISLIIFQLTKTHKLFWPAPQRCLFTGLITLSLFPPWWNSLSLLLSWTAALSLSVLPKSGLGKNFGIYLALYPILHSLSIIHPLTIFINWIIAPLLGLWFYPASLICFFLPPLHQIVDISWGFLVFGLAQLNTLLPNPAASHWTPRYWLWWYLVGLQLLSFMFYKWKVNRKIKLSKKQSSSPKIKVLLK